jgi:hypothetical protein
MSKITKQLLLKYLYDLNKKNLLYDHMELIKIEILDYAKLYLQEMEIFINSDINIEITRRRALNMKYTPIDEGNRIFLTFQNLNNFKFTSIVQYKQPIHP